MAAQLCVLSAAGHQPLPWTGLLPLLVAPEHVLRLDEECLCKQDYIFSQFHILIPLIKGPLHKPVVHFFPIYEKYCVCEETYNKKYS